MRTSPPVARDARGLSREYLEAFHDGVAETIRQIRAKFDVGLTPEMEEWLDEVMADMEKPS